MVEQISKSCNAVDRGPSRTGRVAERASSLAASGSRSGLFKTPAVGRSGPQNGRRGISGATPSERAVALWRWGGQCQEGVIPVVRHRNGIVHNKINALAVIAA